MLEFTDFRKAKDAIERYDGGTLNKKQITVRSYKPNSGSSGSKGYDQSRTRGAVSEANYGGYDKKKDSRRSRTPRRERSDRDRDRRGSRADTYRDSYRDRSQDRRRERSPRRAAHRSGRY